MGDFLSQSILVRILIFIAFFLSGITINICQFILFYTVAFFDIELYRRINYYLTYSIWSQLVALTDWWAGAEVTTYFGDEQSKKLMGTRHTMYMMNHHYEIDWLVAWLVIDRYSLLGNAKSFSKSSLRWIPIIGWSWIFGEFAFLARNWEKDAHKIATALKKFLENKIPVSFLFFAEGTRITEAKHEASVKFATERNLPILNHHLLPRTKGFNFCIRTFKEKYPDMLLAQLQLRFPKDSPKPSFMTILKRKVLRPDVYLKLVPVSEVPSDSDEALNNYLYEMFKEKEELVEYYDKNGKFPGIKEVRPAKKSSLLNWVFWLLVWAIIIPYYMANILIYGSWLTIGIIGTVVVIALGSIQFMLRSTKIEKSSKYGTEEKKSK